VMVCVVTFPLWLATIALLWTKNLAVYRNIVATSRAAVLSLVHEHYLANIVQGMGSPLGLPPCICSKWMRPTARETTTRTRATPCFGPAAGMWTPRSWLRRSTRPRSTRCARAVPTLCPCYGHGRGHHSSNTHRDGPEQLVRVQQSFVYIFTSFI
jgi:hypothetical protein